MQSQTLSGLNLRAYPLGENDKIVVVLTRERGIVRLVAKGSRKPKNRWGGRLEPLIRNILDVARGRGALDILTSATTNGQSAAIMADFDRLLVGLRLAEAAMAVVAEGEANAQAYDAVSTALDLLASGARPELVGLWCELRLLDTGGYRPEFQDCVVCGRPVLSRDSDSVAFSAQGGGVRCAACPLPGRMVPCAAIVLLQAMREAEPALLESLTEPVPGEREAAQILADSLRLSADAKLVAGDLWRRLAE